MALRAVLIDLDGTLWDSAPWFAYLLSPEDAAERRRLAGALCDPAAGLRAASLIAERYTKSRFAAACTDEASRLALYPGASDVLQRLHEHVRLGVVTNLPGWIASPMLAAQGIDELFTHVQTAQRGVPPKPHPAGITRAATGLGVDTTEVVYLGDSRADSTAAARAGVSFLWASWGYDTIAEPVTSATSWMDVGALA